jgi:hypothetical protein
MFFFSNPFVFEKITNKRFFCINQTQGARISGGRTSPPLVRPFPGGGGSSRKLPRPKKKTTISQAG